MSWCQCAACGQTFTSLTSFDRHQDWNYKRKPMLVCRLPASMGLIQGANGMWRVPLSAPESSRLKNLRRQEALGGQ